MFLKIMDSIGSLVVTIEESMQIPCEKWKFTSESESESSPGNQEMNNYLKGNAKDDA